MRSISATWRSTRPRTRANVAIVLLALGAVGLAACGGGSSNQSASSYGSPAPTTSKHATADTLGSASNAALGQTIVVDGSGRTVYLFVPDGSSTRSTVPAGIRANWPPVTSADVIHAGSGLRSDAISVQTQPDGTRQLAYAGHLLYTFVGDGRPGDVNGQGLTNKWYVVSPGGDAIGRATPAPSHVAATTTPTAATTTTQPPHRGNDGDADNKGGPNDDDGNK